MAWAPAAEAQVLAEGRSLAAAAQVEEPVALAAVRVVEQEAAQVAERVVVLEAAQAAGRQSQPRLQLSPAVRATLCRQWAIQ